MYSEIKKVLSRPIVPVTLCIFLALLILWQLSVVVISMFSSSKIDLQHVSNGVNKKEAFQNNPAKSVLNTAFFGDYVPANLNGADIKQSRLNLDIVGILFADDEKDSHVIIVDGGQEKTYYAGDVLPGNVTIKRITTDGVLVVREGSLESLSFPKNEVIFEPAAKPLIGE